MFTSIKIVNRYYWKSLFGPGVMFIFSVLFAFIMGSSWALMDIIKFPSVMPGLCCLTICIVGMFCIPLTLNNFRTSMIMKRLGNSKITSYTFIFAVALYYYLMSIVSFLWTLAWGFVIFCNNIDRYLDVFRYMSVPQLLYAFTITFLLSTAIGMFVLVFTKRNFVIALVAAIVVLLGFVLAGFGAPIPMIHTRGYVYTPPRPQNQSILTNVPIFTNAQYRIDSESPLTSYVYIHPMWYTTSMCYEAFFAAGSGDSLNTYSYTATSIFNPTQTVVSKVITIHQDVFEILGCNDKWANLFVPLGLILIFGGVAIGKFKWNVR